MKTFISEAIQKISAKHDNFVDVVIILPSQRAKVFVKKALKDEISVGFSPQILSIEEFVSDISGIKKIDGIELLFHLYTVYKNQETAPDSFDRFSSWALTVIQDFNEIDQHLVDTHDIFTYIRDIQRLRKWSVKGTFKETDLMKDHYLFLEKLEKYYDEFYSFLLSNNIGYQGVLYREATKKLDAYVSKSKHKEFYFLGFNALNAAEENIFQTLLEQGNTHVYWDIDKAFIEKKHQAGRFVRKYLKNWKYYEKHDIETSDTFFKSKNIQIIGATKNISQIKYAAELLSKFDDYQDTALVLADEGLLPITLNSLPDKVEKVNITMGYPLKDIPTTHLIQSIFQLFLTQEKLGKSASNLFYYKSMLTFLKQGSIQKICNDFDNEFTTKLTTDIAKSNLMFVSVDYIVSFIGLETRKSLVAVFNIFNPYTSVTEFIERVLDLIIALKDEKSPLEKEFFYRYYSVLTQLHNLQNEFNYFTDLKTLAQFFRQLIGSESLSFKGDPLKGLQLMGMLETRVLDFKNIILTSVNEGVLPANTQQVSFIPFDVKQHYSLPTYQEKDAIFAFHFFRLIQRAENVYIIYNTQNDAFGKGEKSRFVSQLQLLRKEIPVKTIGPKVNASIVKERLIKKDTAIIEKLHSLASDGFSPSSIATYLYNPVKFYQQKILKIRDLDEVEETIAMNTMGTVVHDTLEELYKPLLNVFLHSSDIQKMRPKVTPLVNVFFEKHFKNGDLSKGKNRLTYEVAIRFVNNFLDKEEELLKDSNNKLRVIATEQKMRAIIKLEHSGLEVKVAGTVDRVDELNGVLRIIDYKTGKVDAKDLKVAEMSDIIDYKYHKAIQVLLYAYMFVFEKGFPTQEFQAGIFSFKNLNSGFLKMDFKSKTDPFSITPERLDDFKEEIKILLSDIFSEKVDFIEPLDLKF